MKLKKQHVLIVLALAFLTGVLMWRTVWKPKFHYAGTVEATRIDLPSRVATVVSEILVEEGQDIQKGQKLSILACEDLELAAKLATVNFNRALKLQRAGSISKEVFDQLQNKKQDADTRLSWCTINAPVSGTVLTKFLEPKEWANPGTKILTVADLGNLWAYFYVPLEIMSKLKLGAVVVGTIPELHNRRFEGVIAKINEEAEFTPKNVQTQAERTRLVYGIKVAFKNPDRILKPGMTIEADLLE